MQNKANLQREQMSTSLYEQKVYENKSNWTLGENKAKQSQFTFYRRERWVRREEGYLCK